MLNIKLLADKVLVKTPEETKTDSGLIVSRENDVSSFKQGTVVSTGPGLTDKRGIIHSGESYSEIKMHHWNTVNNKIIDITPLIPPFEEYGQKIIKKEKINKNKIDSEKLIKLYKL